GSHHDDSGDIMTIEITDHDSEAMYSFVRTVCKDIGPRAPCSAAEARAAEFIKAEMRKSCDDVAIEPFTCAPGGLLGWIRPAIILVVGSLALYLVVAFALHGLGGIAFYVACIGLVITAWVIAWKEFFSYEEFIDRFLKKGSSQNVVGRIMPTGEVKRVIAFSGHHDSAQRFNLLEYLGGVGYAGSIIWGFGIWLAWTVTLAVAIVLAIAGLDMGGINTFAAWLGIVGSPAMVLLWFFTSSGERGNVVPGAVDNLSAVAVVLAIGRHVRKHPEIVPAGTEIRLISFGCEEAALRGARRFVEAHRPELEHSDFQLVNMDGLQSPKSFMIFSFEPTTRTPHDAGVTRGIMAAARRVGLHVSNFGSKSIDRMAGFFSGGTDAAAFSKVKIPASTFGALDVLKYINNYHTSRDTPDRIEPGTLEGALRICLSFIEHGGKE
ncbi:MAG: M28 family peptidase, partial [Candidatus Lokiarchaeota archaeon]|nr:M28 family peptidase [Candidatus Lokiarchaeota archaeon]